MDAKIFDTSVEGIDAIDTVLSNLDIPYLYQQIRLRREMRSKNGLLVAAFLNDEIRDIRNYIMKKVNNIKDGKQMLNLITVPKRKDSHDYVNDLTKEIDKHLESTEWPENFRTYIYGDKPNNHGWYSFRFPGATRGGIKVNEDNIIEKIEFFKDITLIYKDSVEEAVKKFIGYKIIINNPKEDVSNEHR